MSKISKQTGYDSLDTSDDEQIKSVKDHIHEGAIVDLSQYIRLLCDDDKNSGISVLSWNINQSENKPDNHEKRYGNILCFLKHINADVIGLQDVCISSGDSFLHKLKEIFQGEYAISHGSGYSRGKYFPNEKLFDNIIMFRRSKFDFVSTLQSNKKSQMAESFDNDYSTSLKYTTIHKETEKTICFEVHHFQQEQYHDYYKRLAEIVKKEDGGQNLCVYMGDFNIPLHKLKERIKEIKFYQQYRYSFKVAQDYATIAGTNESTDHFVLFNAEGLVKNPAVSVLKLKDDAEKMKKFYSDHYPILMNFDLQK